jgi:hypothetical protein
MYFSSCHWIYLAREDVLNSLIGLIFILKIDKLIAKKRLSVFVEANNIDKYFFFCVNLTLNNF